MGRAWLVVDDTKKVILYNLRQLCQAARDVEANDLAKDIEAVYLSHIDRKPDAPQPDVSEELFSQLKIPNNVNAGH